MISIEIPVFFQGHVTVEVPDAVPEALRASMARKLAVAQVLATTDNPDNGECLLKIQEELCEAFPQLHEDVVGMAMDSCRFSVGGIWSDEPLSNS